MLKRCSCDNKYNPLNETKKLFALISSAATVLGIIHPDLPTPEIFSIHCLDHLLAGAGFYLDPAIHFLHVYTTE